MINNSTILDQIWLNGTNDYQQRIPRATQRGVQEVQKALFSYTNRNLYNQFVDNLIGKIGNTIINQMTWVNPLGEFKRTFNNMGDTIEEIGFHLLNAHSYNSEAITLFKNTPPKAQVAYHKINRKDRYDLTINQNLLRSAFNSPDGLARFLSQTLTLAKTSDEYDEYRLMLQLLREYQESGYIYTEEVPDVIDLRANQDDVKTFAKRMRLTIAKLKVPSGRYNRAGLPTYVDLNNLVLLILPEVIANLDVEVLATAFNMSRTDLMSRIVEVDEFADPSTVCYLMSRDAFICCDNLLETTSFYNPEQLTTNYYLHHWGTYSISPMLPLVRFALNNQTTIPTVTTTPQELQVEIRDETGQVAIGTLDFAKHRYFIITDLIGTVSAVTDITVKPDSVTYKFEFSDGTRRTQATRVKDNQELKVQRDVSGKDLKITCTSTYQDPSSDTTSVFEKDITITIV